MCKNIANYSVIFCNADFCVWSVINCKRVLHRYIHFPILRSDLSSNEHFLKWVFIININMTLLMNSFSFAKLHHFCFLANHDRGWALRIICTHLFCYVLIDDILFVISFNKRQSIEMKSAQNFVASLLYLT